MNGFKLGLKHGLPIGLGYISVSFTYGLMAAGGGMPVPLVILMSLTNLTSAGQFAGTLLIFSHAPFFEILLTTLVINIRYALMSLSLAQKVSTHLSPFPRALMAFGITDETFTVASLEEKEVTFPYMMGLITLPYIGWALGTSLGALADSLLTPAMQSAAGIALYGMFIALIIPPAKKSKEIMTVLCSAILISCLFHVLPYISKLGDGYLLILSSVLAAAFGAWRFPQEVTEIE